MTLYLWGLVPPLLIAFATWVASVRLRDASLVDRTWSLMIVSPVLVWSPAGPRAWLAVALALAWAVRLAAYITARNRGHGEDRRYQEIRARNEPGFAWKSLYLVFGLQAVLAWLVAAPLFAAVRGDAPPGVLDAIGFALAAFGAVFEAVADAQLARFKRDPAHRGRVMDRGLWAWSRHPNYFGEFCVWWGLFMVACAAGGVAASWTVVSPALMTWLLLKVSGVRLLERDIADRRPGYGAYAARTPAFFPRPPRTAT